MLHVQEHRRRRGASPVDDVGRVAQRYAVLGELGRIVNLDLRALDRARETGSEVNVLIVHDERWYRAASLPFTSEIPRLGGPRRNFTRERADALVGEAVSRVRRVTQALAAETRAYCRYYAVTGAVLPQLERLVTGRRGILVAMSEFESLPICEQARRLSCEVILIDRDAAIAGQHA